MIEAALIVAAVVIAAFVLAPAFGRPTEQPTDPRAALEAAREAALRALHDLELDWATGKLADEDYQAQRAAMEAEAAAILRQLSQRPP